MNTNSETERYVRNYETINESISAIRRYDQQDGTGKKKKTKNKTNEQVNGTTKRTARTISKVKRTQTSKTKTKKTPRSTNRSTERFNRLIHWLNVCLDEIDFIIK